VGVTFVGSGTGVSVGISVGVAVAVAVGVAVSSIYGSGLISVQPAANIDIANNVVTRIIEKAFFGSIIIITSIVLWFTIISFYKLLILS
jgi:hypothetical protein